MNIDEAIRDIGGNVSNALSAAADIKSQVLAVTSAVSSSPNANAAQVSHAVAVGQAQGNSGGRVPAAQLWNATKVNQALSGIVQSPVGLLVLLALGVWALS